MPGPSRLRAGAGGNGRPPPTTSSRRARSPPRRRPRSLAARRLRADSDARARDRPLMVRPRPTRSPTTRASPGATGCRISCRCASSRRFQNSGAVKAVTSSYRSVNTTLALRDPRPSRSTSSSGRPIAEIDIFAKLINVNSCKVVATKGFSARVAGSDTTRPPSDRRTEPGLHRGPARHHDLGRRPPR